jgi:hypothetical protein
MEIKKGGKRALSSWNLFVKKVYREGKMKNKNYAFKDALKDASNRKGEMGSQSTKKMRKSRGKKGKRGTRRR